MLVDVKLIPDDQLDNLIKEFLLQMGSFDDGFEYQAEYVQKVKQQLFKKELLVSYSEQDESIGIVSADSIAVKPQEMWPD
ncbi:YheU family protein [Catenovulum sediminis]|uniref:YheU family protein n=1 Tax=Catenovulum sediminis TaxID=1740262 RepID=A0ABV1RG00_9ALTE|nr:YheU family protein [Catenovulum sediminis]